MSRIGNKIITLKDGVSVTVEENNKVTVKGPKGEITNTFSNDIEIVVEGSTVKITRPSDSIKHKSLHGTTRALLSNMVVGVSDGFSKTLEITGVGYRASLNGNTLVLNMGFSHLVEMPVPQGLTVSVPNQTEITVSGIDKQSVGQFTAEIREVKKPEPYKGKGIRYRGEVVRRKEGKKAK